MAALAGDYRQALFTGDNGAALTKGKDADH